MDIEKYQKNYSKWNYYEKLEDMQSIARWTSEKLKSVVNWSDAYDYVMELADEWETRAKVYLTDVELESMHPYIKDTIEYLERLRKDYFDTFGVFKPLFAELMKDIVMLVSTNMPKDIKMRKIFFEMQKQAEEIAPLLEMEPNVFFEVMKKMSENSDKIADIIDFQRVFR